MQRAIEINLPVHSVLITPNTPGSKIPSHGTKKYGEMYAIDFVVINQKSLSKKPYKSSFITYLVKGIQLSDFYGWGQSVYAPIDGEVVKVVDGIEERNPVNVFSDLKNTIRVTREYEAGEADSTSITGNCVIIKASESEYCLLAHLRKNSIRVRIGQKVNKDTIIGELGHSGNSTMPHLHMQFVDSIDFNHANGLPFTIKEYSVYVNKRWISVSNQIPKNTEIIKW